MTEVLRRAGDTLTHENLIRQATSLKDVKLPAAARHQRRHDKHRLHADPSSCSWRASTAGS
jgi:hypothetical protein